MTRDLAGYTESANLYAYSVGAPVIGVDPLGAAWKMISRYIYEAGKDDDNLEDLAKKVSGEPEDWRCIWPVPHWSKERQAAFERSKGATDAGCKADVTNLKIESGPELRIRMVGWLRNWMWFGNWELITSGQEIAQRIKEVSHEGETPISRFSLVGHGGCMTGKWNEDTDSIFKPKDQLSAVSGSTTYSRAVAKRGPYRCWFTRHATSRFYGCFSSGFARVFAAEALRKPAEAWGLPADMSVKSWHIAIQISPGGSYRRHMTWRGVLSDPAWIRYEGGRRP